MRPSAKEFVVTLSPLVRVGHATLRIDGAAAERELRARLPDGWLGKAVGNRIYLDFKQGEIKLSSGFRTRFGDATAPLLRTNKVVIGGTSITLSIQPLSVRAFDYLVKWFANKLPSFIRVVTGKEPALVVNLSVLPAWVNVTVQSIAFVPGALLVTIGSAHD
jgi:hypothetical protein